MTPARTHGLIQAISESALSEAADLRKEADDMRAKASENDRIAGVLEALHQIAHPHARRLEILDGGAA